MNTRDLRLNHLKVSKYRFAQMMEVSWNTVHFWERGVWKPTKKHEAKMQELVRQKENPQGVPTV